jgi:hypothetical protein
MNKKVDLAIAAPIKMNEWMNNMSLSVAGLFNKACGFSRPTKMEIEIDSIKRVKFI